MATITYGKGKILRPTPLAALKETMAQNARDGKVEMLDISTRRKREVTAEARVPVQSEHADAQAAKNRLVPVRRRGTSISRHDAVGENQRQQEAAEKSAVVRVRILAPEVLEFFASNKRDEPLVMSDEHQAE